MIEHDLDAWDLFVLRHTKPGNLAVHFVSFLMFFGAPVLALLTWDPWWLLAFFLSGGVGAAGHYAFDDAGVSLREATSTPTVPFFVAIMFYKLARRTYWADVAAARTKLERLRARGVELPHV